MKAVSCLLLLCLTGCAGQSHYRPAGADGLGFSERRLDEQHYLIEAGSRQGQDAARRLALQRSAELAGEAGYDWFAVTDSQSSTNANGSRVLLQVRLGRGVAPSGEHVHHARTGPAGPD